MFNSIFDSFNSSIDVMSLFICSIVSIIFLFYYSFSS